MSDNILASVRDTIGKFPHLGLFECVTGFRMLDADSCVVRIDRASITERRNSYTVNQRGVTLNTYTRQADASWKITSSTTQWWSIVPEEHQAIAPRQRDHEWESICHRPGTDRFPMDNGDRIAQGYTA